MVILNDRLFERPFALASFESVPPFARVPAVIRALLDDVDLLPDILPDIARPQIAGLWIEGHAPNVARSQRPHLGLRTLRGNKWIVGGNGVWLAFFALLVHIDAKDLCQESAEILPVEVRIIGRAAIAEREVEKAVGAKDNSATVVVGVRLRLHEENLLGVGIGELAVLAHREARKDRAARLVCGVVHIQLALGRKCWVKRDRKQTFLIAAVVDPLANVEHDLDNAGVELGRIGDENAARLLDDVEIDWIARTLNRLNRPHQSKTGQDALESRHRNGIAHWCDDRLGRGRSLGWRREAQDE